MFKKARKISVGPEVVRVIAQKLDIAESEVVEAIAGNLDYSPRAKDVRGLALVVYGGTLQAVEGLPKTERR